MRLVNTACWRRPRRIVWADDPLALRAAALTS